MEDMNRTSYQNQVFCRICIIAVITSVIFLDPAALARVVPAFDIDKLLKESDLAAVIKPAQPLGKVEVISIYSGELTSQDDFISITTDDPRVISALNAKRDICIFLKKKREKGKSSFVLVSEDYPFFHVVPERPEESLTGKDAIESELILGLESPDSVIVVDSVLWLRRLNSAKGQEEILRLAKEPTAPLPIQAFALEVEIPKGDKQVIKDAVAFLEETSEYKGRARWRFHLVWSFSKIKETNDVEFLSRLLIEGTREVARGLSFSSREWGNNTSIPFLIGAMERLDKEGQYRCIVTLVKLTKRSWPGSGHNEFMADPSKYVLDWQKWWAAGKPVTPAVPAHPKPIERVKAVWAWPSFFLGAVVGILVVTLVMMLAKKARSRGK